MAVYNPYDQLVFEDPAYLTDPNKAKEQIQEETRGIANIIARTAGPIAGIATNPVKYQQTLDQEQRNRQILEQLGITNRQLNRDEMERAKAAGYVPLTTGQALGKISGFLYSDLVKGSDNIRAGVDYYDLPENERMGVAMGLLDMADIALIPAAFKKLATIGVQKLGKTNLKTIAQDPELQKQFPNETKEILTITGGGFTPAGVVREAEMGGSAPIKTARTGTIAERVTTYLDQLPQGERIGMTKLMRDLNLTNRQVRAVLDEKKYKPYTDKIDKTIIEAEGSKAQQIKNFLENVSGTTTFKEIADNLNMTPSSVRNIIKAKTIGKLRNKITPVKTSDIPDKIRDYLKNLDEPVSYEFLADELGLDSRKASSTINLVTKSNPELSAKVFTEYGKKDFGQGLEKPSEFLKRTFNAMPTGEKITKKELKSKYGLSNQNINEFLAKNKDYIEYIEPPKTKFKKSKGQPSDVVTPILNEYKNVLGIQPGSRTEFLFFDGMLRSSSPEVFNLDPSLYSKKDFYRLVMSDFAENNPNWRQTFAKDLETMKKLEDDRNATNIKMEEYFNEMKKKNPEVMKDLNFTDYRLNVAHNIPLGLSGKDFPEVGGLTGAARLSFAKTNLLHHKRLEELLTENLNEIREQGLIEKTADGKVKVPPVFNEFLDIIDKKAKKLGTVIYFKLGDEVKKVGMEATPSPEALLSSFKNHINGLVRNREKYSPKKTEDNFAQAKVFLTSKKEKEYFDDTTDLAKGGAVKMARGGIGDILQNINQQEFTPDPAIDGDSAFQQAVKSENLYAFNPSKILKFFGDKVPGVFTPSKRNKNMELMSDAPSAPGTTLPVEQPIQDYDFAFKSFTLDKVNSKNAPKAAKPQDWINFLQGGDIAPKAEILDSGLFQYMEDFERYYPNQKLTREQITEFYEQSPISNLQVKVKAGRDDASPYDVMSQETMGRARHKNAGSARIDEGGENYREIVIEAGALPGEEKPFISSGHFEEPNVLVFSRVADYKNADGQNVSVIQEMQTDLLTKVRKEQERLAAAIGEAKVKLAANQRVIEAGDQYRMENATQNIQRLSQEIPKLEQLAETKLIKPYPLTVAKELIPTYEKQLLDLQQEINALAQAGVDRTDPEFLMKISQIEQQQQGTLNELLNLNRSKNFETLTQDVKVPTASNSEELQQIAQNQSSYHNTRPIETFPPIPFNNQADYVDLILKATIKDAENRGVNKIAIMPADVGANPRWNKNNEDARKKFQNLYDKVGVQQLKNIAKKYGGNVEIEKISDPTRSTMGLRISKPSLNRDSFDFLKDVDVDRRAVENDPEGARNFLDEEIIRIASDLGDKSVIYRKETAPGQTMDYYVDLYTVNTDRETVKKYNLVPLDPDDVDTNAQILIEDYNPSLVDMFVLTMDEGKQKAPMYMFKKKEGGIIPEDRLVSITDIYGDY